MGDSLSRQHDGMRRRQAAVHGDGLAIHVRRGIRREKYSGLSDFLRNSVALQRVELADFTFTAVGARALEYWASHSGLNQTWADGIDANTGSAQLVGHRLHQADDAGFAGAVGNSARPGPQTGD